MGYGGVLVSAAVTDRIQSSASRHPLALVVFGVLLYSTGPVLLQASSVSGPVFSFWRLWFGVPVLGAAMLAQQGRSGWPSRAAWRWALWAGLAFGIHQLLFMTAIKVTSVTDVSLMNTLAPLVTAVGAAQMFGERPGARFRAWTVLAILGAALVVLGASTGPQGHPLGMTMAAANVVFFAVFFLLSKRARREIPVLPFLFGVIVIAAMTVTGFVVVADQAVGAVSSRDLMLAAIVAAGPGAVGHFVMTWPLRWVPANVPPVLRLGQPILSGLLAWWLLGEAITDVHLLGGALTLAGVCGAMLTPAGRAVAGDDAPT